MIITLLAAKYEYRIQVWRETSNRWWVVELCTDGEEAQHLLRYYSRTQKARLQRRVLPEWETVG